jgi:hypothetical protein
MVVGKTKKGIDFVMYNRTKGFSKGVQEVAESIRRAVPILRLQQSFELEDTMHRLNQRFLFLISDN